MSKDQKQQYPKGFRTDNLTKEQNERLKRFIMLKEGVGKFATGSKPLCCKPPKNKVKITAEQVRKIKEMLEKEIRYLDITMETGCSDFHISGVKEGKYDFLLNGGDK